MSKKTKRAYKYRFYPTEEQKKILAQTFGCVRFVYNWGLSTRKTAYFQHGQSLYYNDLAAMLPSLKDQYPWLKDVSSVPLQQALRHLDHAFVNFFEGRADYPVFNKKRNDQSATYPMPSSGMASTSRWRRWRLLWLFASIVRFPKAASPARSRSPKIVPTAISSRS